MKVLHIGKYFPPYAGGMETYLRDLMVAQQRQGIESSALVHRSDLSLTSTDEMYQAGEQKLPVTRAAVWARLLFTPISPTFPWLLNRLIKDKNPNVLHLHMPNVSVFWALALPRARKIPWVIQWHSDVVPSEYSTGLSLFYRLYRPFERMVLKQAAAIIASSPPYLASSEPLKDFRSKCHVIPLGIEPPAVIGQPLATNLRPLKAGLQVLAIGRLTYYKGFDTLLRAVAEAPEVHLRLVGSGELGSDLRSLTAKLGIEDRVTLLGHIPDAELEQEWASCDCLCLPSVERTEAYGLVLLEAMARGIATIASDVQGSGMGWIVEDDKTGLKVAPQSSQALASAMHQLGKDRDKLRVLGEHGSSRFRQHFHIDRSADGIAGLYNKLFDSD
jgi:glycosyltransferase involved in cell wall biosynthesis